MRIPFALVPLKLRKVQDLPYFQRPYTLLQKLIYFKAQLITREGMYYFHSRRRVRSAFRHSDSCLINF